MSWVAPTWNGQNKIIEPKGLGLPPDAVVACKDGRLLEDERGDSCDL